MEKIIKIICRTAVSEELHVCIYSCNETVYCRHRRLRYTTSTRTKYSHPKTGVEVKKGLHFKASRKNTAPPITLGHI